MIHFLSIQLVGEAALRPGMLKVELAELMYYMEEHRTKRKRRVSIILTDTQVTVNDMTSAVRQTGITGGHLCCTCMTCNTMIPLHWSHHVGSEAEMPPVQWSGRLFNIRLD